MDAQNWRNHDHIDRGKRAGTSTSESAELTAARMVTLQTYAHLMPVDNDRARSVLDRVLGAGAAEDWVRTEQRG